MSGVRANTSATSSSVKRMPASWAIAGRCRPALVEPPVAATAAAAFSSDLRVTRSRGSGPPSRRISVDAPAGAARQRQALGIDRGQHRRAGQREPERLGHHRHRVGGELAGQEPSVGAQACSKLGELGLGHGARQHRADALVGVSTVTSRPRQRPGSIAPP